MTLEVANSAKPDKMENKPDSLACAAADHLPVQMVAQGIVRRCDRGIGRKRTSR